MAVFEVRPQRLQAGAAVAVGTGAGQAPSIPCHGVLVKAICPGQTVYVGSSSGVLTTTGYPLPDGHELDLAVKNTNQLWFIGSAASLSVRLLPYVFT